MDYHLDEFEGNICTQDMRLEAIDDTLDLYENMLAIKQYWTSDLGSKEHEGGEATIYQSDKEVVTFSNAKEHMEDVEEPKSTQHMDSE